MPSCHTKTQQVRPLSNLGVKLLLGKERNIQKKSKQGWRNGEPIIEIINAKNQRSAGKNLRLLESVFGALSIKLMAVFTAIIANLSRKNHIANYFHLTRCGYQSAIENCATQSQEKNLMRCAQSKKASALFARSMNQGAKRDSILTMTMRQVKLAACFVLPVICRCQLSSTKGFSLAL